MQGFGQNVCTTHHPVRLPEPGVESILPHHGIWVCAVSSGASSAFPRIPLCCYCSRPDNEAMDSKSGVAHIEAAHDHSPHIVPIDQEASENVQHVDLSWRSWIVVFCCCFAYALPHPFLGYISHDPASCLRSLLSWPQDQSCPLSFASWESQPLLAGLSRCESCHAKLNMS